MIIYGVSWRYHWCSGCKFSTLSRLRIGLQTVSLFAVSARTLPAQCETRDEISGSGVSLRSGKRAPTERGIKPWIEGLPETLPLIPQFEPLRFQVPPVYPSGAPLPSWWTINGARKRSNARCNLHRWPIMLKYAMLHWCNMLQYLSPQWYCKSCNIHYYWTHPRAWIQGTRTNCQCQLVSSQKQKTPSKGSKNVSYIAFNLVYIFSVVYAQSFATISCKCKRLSYL